MSEIAKKLKINHKIHSTLKLNTLKILENFEKVDSLTSLEWLQNKIDNICKYSTTGNMGVFWKLQTNSDLLRSHNKQFQNQINDYLENSSRFADENVECATRHFSGQLDVFESDLQDAIEVYKKRKIFFTVQEKIS